MSGRDRPIDPVAEVGAMVGPYRLEALLGEGGMGRVFRAARGDGQPVALKVLRSELASDRQFSRRFAREARAAAEVAHKHLVKVLDFGEDASRQYMAMEYIPGESLEEALRRHGVLGVDRVIRLAAEVGTALDALHRAGVVHRDVKAANILLDQQGKAMLTDFGLAKGAGYSVLTAPGQVIGTLDYLAPELIRGEPASPQSDIYALGCVVFECLSGRPPFSGKGMLEAGMSILDESPPDPCAGRTDTPPMFSEIVLHALAKAPEDRPPTATAYAHLLQVAARDEVG